MIGLVLAALVVGGVRHSIDLAGLAGSVRILLADDNAVDREVSTALLQDAGLGADTVRPGGAGGGAAAPLRPGAEDVHMPGLDGLEATRRIRALPEPRLPMR